MELSDLIKEYRAKHVLSMNAFAKKCNLSKAYISLLENKINPRNQKPVVPTIDTLRALALGMDLELDQLIRIMDDQLVSLADKQEAPTILDWEDQDNIESIDEMGFAAFDVVGLIAAGYGAEAIEEYTGEIEYIPYSMLHGRSPSAYFVLKVKGNSMYPHLMEGDKVLVLRCTSVDSGSIAVVMYNGFEATLKKVNYISGEDWMELIPANPEYQTKRIEGSALEECRVLGKVVTLIRNM